jgi:predicted unusual protein kinase regulating ubiquinone biosynthesis (AarF/ABC1/UbiB family)
MSPWELEGRRDAIELPGDACYRLGIRGLPARQRDPPMNFARIAELLRGRAAAPPATTYPAIVQPMPRREVSHAVDSAVVTLPRARPPVAFKPGVLRPIGRLLVWLGAFLRFYFGNLVDVLLRRDTVERRAVRLRRVFEDGGPTFAKLAQQLSMRADMLPYPYCVELSKMLDQAAAFPTQKAVEIIERNLGRPLEDVFEVFDPVPIGSASLACVFQAELKTGERVAVKVRRPGIGPLIAADLRALDWILIVGETLTIIAPGVSRRFREDFETILFNEMNFRAEARYTDIFRRRAEKRKKDVTAPRVHFQYCTEEVMVSELVTGVWMWEVLAAVDSNDRQFLAQLRRQGIEPKKLASKLVRIMNRETQEELFFHADPHPANLIILPDNRICFIDFGAIGRFSTQTRKLFRELAYHTAQGDIGRIVNTSLSFLGALPPMDVERVRVEMEKIYSDAVYALQSEDAEWWEKSAAQGWLRFLEVAREFSLPASFEAILFFRTTFSYDIIIHRLNRKIDIVKEWQGYQRERAKEASKRVKGNFKQRLLGPTDMDYLQMEEFGDMLTLMFFQLQRNIETPIIHFRNIVGKISYIASLFLKLGYLVGVAFAIGLVANWVSQRWFGHEINWAPIFERVSTFGWVQLALIVVALVIIRRIVIRLSLPDTRLGPER